MVLLFKAHIGYKLSMTEALTTTMSSHLKHQIKHNW
jgi:hypothetical protein